MNNKYYVKENDAGKDNSEKMEMSKWSDRKEFNDNSQQSQNFLKNILNSSTEISIISTDLDGNILFWNKGAENIFGYTATEIVGKQKMSILYTDPKTRQIASQMRNEVLKTGQAVSKKMLENHKNGSDIWVDITVSANINEQGEIIGLLGIGKDITKQKEAEQILEKKMKIENFINLVSSEFINSNSTDIDSLIVKVLKNISQILKIDRAYVFKLSSSNKLASITHEWCLEREDSVQNFFQNIPIAMISFLEEKIKNHDVIAINSISKLPIDDSFKLFLSSKKIKSALFIPMVIGKKIIGYLGFDTVIDNIEWNQSTIDLLKMLGEIITNSLERNKSEIKNLRHIYYLESIQKINRAINNNNKDIPSMIQKVIDLLQKMFQVDRAWLLNPINPKEDFLTLSVKSKNENFSWKEPKGDLLKMSDRISDSMDRMIENKKVSVFNSSLLSKIDEFKKNFDIKSMMCVPLFPLNGKPWLLGMYQCSYDRLWQKHEIQLFNDISLILTNSINNLIFYKNLKESEERFKDVSLSIADWIWEIDPQGIIKYASPKVANILGFSSEELIGKNFFSLLPDVHDNKIQDYFNDISKKHHSFHDFKNWKKHKDGTTKCFLSTGVPFYDIEEKFIGYRGVDRDITDKINSEIEIKENLTKMHKLLEDTVMALSFTIENRDPYTSGHQKRMTEIAILIAEEMSLSKDIKDCIRTAGLLHDIGKIYVPAEILNKPGKISALERALIQGHAQAGYDILKNIEFPWPVSEAVLQHHERMDGSGYPNNLKGDDIRLEAKILAVADVVETIASHRPYRAALGPEIAIQEIRNNRGTKFDEKVVDACLNIIKDKKLILHDFNDNYTKIHFKDGII